MSGVALTRCITTRIATCSIGNLYIPIKITITIRQSSQLSRNLVGDQIRPHCTTLPIFMVTLSKTHWWPRCFVVILGVIVPFNRGLSTRLILPIGLPNLCFEYSNAYVLYLNLGPSFLDLGKVTKLWLTLRFHSQFLL